MARRRKREEKPAASNRGRSGARGVFVIFDEEEAPASASQAEPVERAEDEPLARDATDEGDAAA
jgi:hypothetical protein